MTLTGTWIGSTDSQLGLQDRLKWAEQKLKFKIGHGTLAVPEVFVGSKAVMKKAVEIVNSRPHLLRMELIPQIRKPLSHYILDVLTKIHDKIPNNVLYPATNNLVDKITSVVKPSNIL